VNRLLLAAPLLASLACSPRRPAADASAALAPCLAVTDTLAAGAQADDLRGTYRLELVASRGARAGDSTSAELELVAADDSLQSWPGASGLRDTTARYPLLGWTTVDPAAVGGTDTGPLDSRDPAAPGVLVIERQTRRAEAPKEILLRLGAEANRRDRVRFDGGYFALTVLRIDGSGFAGTWASSAGGPAAGGHYCARRSET
jgi:hypothetical protein